MNTYQLTENNSANSLISQNGTFYTLPIPLASSRLVVRQHPPPHNHPKKRSSKHESSDGNLTRSAWLIVGMFALSVVIIVASIYIYRRRSALRASRQRVETNVQTNPTEHPATATHGQTVSRDIIATFPKYTYWRKMATEPTSQETFVAGEGEAIASGVQQTVGSSYGIESDDARSGGSSQRPSAAAPNRSAPASQLNVMNASQPAKDTSNMSQQRWGHIPWFPANSWRQVECPICLQQFRNGRSVVLKLPCNHIFHSSCIAEYLTCQSTTCPTCRVCVLPPDSLTVDDPHTAPQPVTQPVPQQWWQKNKVVVWVVGCCEDAGIGVVLAGVKNGTIAVWKGMTYLRRGRLAGATAGNPPEQVQRSGQVLR
ncbi:hypothetical protein KEM54_000546 [Ascosphaera aggregata]|nr:hypothetical protein KEM54_000546 [Ascosphaera aggregata]